jgi:hypothetical protein
MRKPPTSMNRDLQDLYKSQLGRFRRIAQSHSSLSEPLLLSVPSEYERAAKRLLVVGQQTWGWTGHGEINTLGQVEWLMKGYEHFSLGRHYIASPFWQASHELYSRLNPGCPAGGFMWSNLVKVDQDGNRPSAEVEEQICRMEILPVEIEILEPDVTVFFTGPRYDARLRSTFFALQFVPMGDCFDRIEHPVLPFHTYRTYHPKFLRLARKWHTIADIAQEVHCYRP